MHFFVELTNIDLEQLATIHLLLKPIAIIMTIATSTQKLNIYLIFQLTPKHYLLLIN
jgi:hypothetical protein